MEWRLARWQGLNGVVVPHPRHRRSPFEHDDPLGAAVLQDGGRIYMRVRRSTPLE